ncbi:hypothetical protein PPM_p0078 (plasmid) [Paenibacillus polymyxa M1]|nr:hypothetical protein PPM_p0078 [Paenibacillus polymyxa M1]
MKLFIFIGGDFIESESVCKRRYGDKEHDNEEIPTLRRGIVLGCSPMQLSKETYITVERLRSTILKCVSMLLPLNGLRL